MAVKLADNRMDGRKNNAGKQKARPHYQRSQPFVYPTDNNRRNHETGGCQKCSAYQQALQLFYKRFRNKTTHTYNTYC